MDEQLTPSPAPSAPVAPVAPSTPPVPSSLAEFRAQKNAPPAEVPAVPAIAATEARPPATVTDDGEDGLSEGQPESAPGVQGPEETPNHRWKDPTSGITLDLRRRDHRRIKRVLEDGAAVTRERDELLMRMRQGPPATERQAPPERPDDPEPKLEDFANESDPYLAHARALARYEAKQEFRREMASHTQVERARQVQQRIDHAQRAFDAKLPSVKQRYPDFDSAQAEVVDVLSRIPRAHRAHVVHRLLTSQLGHDLTHYLGSHPDDLAAVVSARSAHEQGVVLGAIEARVHALVNRAKKPVSPMTPPAAPIAPTGSNATTAGLPDAKSMTLAQFRANKAKFGRTA